MCASIIMLLHPRYTQIHTCTHTQNIDIEKKNPVISPNHPPSTEYSGRLSRDPDADNRISLRLIPHMQIHYPSTNASSLASSSDKPTKTSNVPT